MTKVLGKKQSPNKSGKRLLDPIQRNKDPITHGIDIWNVYDFMYLNKNKDLQCTQDVPKRDK